MLRSFISVALVALVASVGYAETDDYGYELKKPFKKSSTSRRSKTSTTKGGKSKVAKKKASSSSVNFAKSSEEEPRQTVREEIVEMTAPVAPSAQIQTAAKPAEASSRSVTIRIRPMAAVNLFSITGASDARLQNGLTGESAYGSSDPSYSNLVTPSGGIGVEIGVRKYLAIDTGAMVFQSGAKADDVGAGRRYNEWSAYYPGNYYDFDIYEHDRRDELRLTYVGIPVLAKFSFSGVKEGGFYARVGVMPAVLTNAELERVDIIGDQGTYDVKDVYEDFDLFFSAGIGWDLFVTDNTAIVFSSDVHAGTVDINKEAKKEQRNLGGSLGFGVTIQM